MFCSERNVSLRIPERSGLSLFVSVKVIKTILLVPFKYLIKMD
jgi:hypothetical protein